MICRVVERLAPLHAGRELPGLLLARLDAHVGGCSGCQAHLTRYEGDRARLGALGEAHLGAPTPDACGENFWLAIRRDLRTEGLVAPRGGRAAAPLSREHEGLFSRGLAVRAALALVVIAGAAWSVSPWGAPSAGPSGRETARSAPSSEAERAPLAVRSVGFDLGLAARPGAAGLERVGVEAEGVRPWLDAVEPLGPPATSFPLEGWQTPGSERAVLDF